MRKRIREIAGIREHCLGPSAELKSGGGTTEHPSKHNAERIMFISPRGETVVARSAVQREGCSQVPNRSLYLSTHSALCLEGCPVVPPPLINSAPGPKRCSLIPAISLILFLIYVTFTFFISILIQLWTIFGPSVVRMLSG